MNSTAALKTLAKKDPLKWPTVKLLLRRRREEGLSRS